MSINLTDPKTLLEKLDAARNFIGWKLKNYGL